MSVVGGLVEAGSIEPDKLKLPGYYRLRKAEDGHDA